VVAAYRQAAAHGTKRVARVLARPRRTWRASSGTFPAARSLTWPTCLPRPKEEDDAIDDLTFAVIGDLHVGATAEAVQTTIRLLDERDLDFVLFLGDLVNTPTAENVAAFAEAVRRIDKPVYLTIGNHDVGRMTEGFDIEAELARDLPGPWKDGFTYAFDAGGWRFVVCSLGTFNIGYTGPQVNRYKGVVSEFGDVLNVPPRHLERFGQLLDATGETPTCVVTHVPLVRMAERVHARGCYGQVRLLEEIQMLSLVEARPNVKMCLYGHEHFNQADVIDGRLHLITQGVRGMAQYGDADAIRIMRIADGTVASGLIWDGLAEQAPAPLGTLEGDRAFEWRFA